nr:zinc ABC transporter substrate-binding protein [Polycladospora coralii]
MKTEQSNNNKIQVYSSIYPLQFFAERIGSHQVNVHTIVPPGVEPHDFELTIKNITNLNEADILLYNGGGLEPWLEKNLRSLKDDVRVVNTSESITDYTDLNDPHVWLNPLFAKQQAAAIKDAFIVRDPAHKSLYIENFEKLSKELDQLDQEYQLMTEKASQKSFLVSHDAFGHLADRYQLKQIPISGLSPSDEPSPQALKSIMEQSRNEKVKVIYFETLVNGKFAEVVQKELGLSALVLNPLEGLTDSEISNGDDYFTIMRKNKAQLAQGLGVKP